MNPVAAAFRQKPFLIGILILFGLLYCDISLVNHYVFRTYGWDLGIFNNSVWDYSHFRWNANNIEAYKIKNILADHFEIYPILFSPLRFIFGTYVLLVCQIASMLFGGYGIYRFLLLKTKNEPLAALGMVHFFLSWGIYAALSFDFHSNVISATMVPWFLFYFEKRKTGMAALFFFLIITGKENMALWAIFIGLALALSNLKNKPQRNYAILLSVIAFVYFTAIVKWVMPSLDPMNTYQHILKYRVLGSNFSEDLITVFTRPLYTIKLLFINTSGDSSYDGIKLRTHIMILITGGIALFIRPKYLLMLLPIYGQKFYIYSPGTWGLGEHYSIELTPIISIALFEAINAICKGKIAVWVGAAFCVITALVTLYFIQNNDKRIGSDFINKQHYNNSFNIKAAYRAMELIPANASLSAQTEFCPHLAFRDTIFLYPDISSARYIMVCRSNAAWPLSMAEHQEKIAGLLNSRKWQAVYDDNNILILKKMNSK